MKRDEPVRLISTVPLSNYQHHLSNLVARRREAANDGNREEIKKLDRRISALKNEISVHGLEHEIFAMKKQPFAHA